MDEPPIVDSARSSPRANELRRSSLVSMLPGQRAPATAASVVRGNRTIDGRTATAALVQLNPATHGSNLENQRGELRYRPGFPFPGSDPFPQLAAPIPVDEPSRELQESIVRFIDSTRAGVAEIASPVAPEPY